MATYTNESKGARSILLRSGEYLLIEAGESVEMADASVKLCPADVKITGRKPTVSVSEDKRAKLEALDDDELRAFVEKLTGKAPHPNAKRETLIEKALAAPAQ